jgi:signal transduction histidine kinase/CheY-like chemotaxis protein
MTSHRFRSATALRGACVAITFALVWVSAGIHQGPGFLGPILVAFAGHYLLTTTLGRRQYGRYPVPLLFLAGDVLAMGAAGCFLPVGLEPQVAFLAGYLVAVLVGVVGRDTAAAVLGTLAGAMVMGLCTALFAVLERSAPDFAVLTLQTVLLAGASFLTARVTGWLDEEHQRRQINERVEREMQKREAESAALVSFTQDLAASGSLGEMAQAVLRHLRVHLGVRARAVTLESKGESVATWEEDGRLTDEGVERRRCMLQEVLVRAGASQVVYRLEARSLASRDLPPNLDFATRVEVPIRAGGRVAGAVFVADPSRGVVSDAGIAILADVARRTAEALVRMERHSDAQQRRTGLLLRQMREGVLLLAPDGSLLLANPAARDCLGCRGPDDPLPDTIGPYPLAELARTPAGVTRRFSALAEAAEGGQVDLACTAVGVLDGAKVMGTLVTLRDVTEEETARNRLVKAEKTTLVGQTLAGVAHELNNPLTALIGYADLLAARQTSPEVDRTLGKIREQALRASRIVRNLLSIARRKDPERAQASLKEIVDTVVELFAYEARLARARVDVEVPETLRVLADRHALQQVFVNLLQNALHALEDWGGEKRIRIQARELPDGLIVSVSDTGPGIPEALRTRIFHPFFTTKGPTRGTGLGLALSRSIARDHGGDLLLDHAGEGGARFLLRLPVSAGARMAAPRTPSDVPLPYHILVVDDEQDVREALVSQLGRLGCQVESTSTAEEALRLVRNAAYDRILVDVRMPGTSGLELHETLTGNSPDTARRVVFMSGDVANEDLIASIQRTGNRFLEKPFTLPELRQALGDDLAPPERGVTAAAS